MQPSRRRLNLFRAAIFSQFKRHLPNKTATPNGLRRRRDCVITWTSSQNKRSNNSGMPSVARFHLSSNSNFVSHLLQVPKAIDMYHRWGPSARNCLIFARSADRETQYAASVRAAATSFVSDPPTGSYPGQGLALIAGSPKLFCIRPTPGEKGFLVAQSTVISPHVQLIIQDAVSRVQHEKRI
jgi:hypothetical protein